MEKPAVAKAKNKFLAFLPKAAKAAAAIRFEFETPPLFSPGKEKRATANATTKQKPHQNRGYSGAITSAIFQEVRSKSKNSRFEAKEPTSPKISCMGQIKHKKNIDQKIKHVSLNKDANPFSSLPRESRKKSSAIKTAEVNKKELNSSRNIFSSAAKPKGRKSDASAEVSRLPDRAPTLSQTKRFASSRDTLSQFDWKTAQVVPGEEPGHHRRYYSDDERGYSDGEDEEVITSFSGPLMVGGVRQVVALEPKKEINLWKRRTMAQPKPLQLNIAW